MKHYVTFREGPFDGVTIRVEDVPAENRIVFDYDKKTASVYKGFVFVAVGVPTEYRYDEVSSAILTADYENVVAKHGQATVQFEVVNNDPSPT